jgi:hypothetical protein
MTYFLSNFSVKAKDIRKESLRQTFLLRSRSTFLHHSSATSSFGFVIHFRTQSFVGFTSDTCHSPVCFPFKTTGLAADHCQHRSLFEDNTSSDGGFRGKGIGSGGFGCGIFP